MKELIYSVSTILYIAICIVIFIVVAMHVNKAKTSRYFKVTRNMCVVACISALIACFSLKTIFVGILIYPFLAVPVWLFYSILYHKGMVLAKECEIREKECLKTHTIDVLK